MDGETEARLRVLGITLPAVWRPVANYVATRCIGPLMFISGQISRRPDGSVVAGRLGEGLSIEEGQAAARLAALAMLAQAAAELGTLDRIRHAVRVTGYVNAAPSFQDHSMVVNGASDVLIEVLGDKGRHTRAAVGASSLPGGAAVEIEAILEIG